MNHFISTTLGMKDKNIEFESKIEEKEYKGKNMSILLWEIDVRS